MNIDKKDSKTKYRIKLGKNFKYVYDNTLSAEKICDSWNVILKRESDGMPGLRTPQLGALYAVLAHWTVSQEPATVVMPTGTGKTETMILTIVNEKIQRCIILVPSNFLREQTVNKVFGFGVLKQLKIVSENSVSPNVLLLKSIPKTQDEFDELLENTNVIVTTISLVNKFDKIQKERLVSYADLLIVDEAHHIEANKWRQFKELFNGKKVLQFTATPFRNDGKKIDGKIIYNYPLRKAQAEEYFQKINFYPIYEFNDKKGDMAIARKAIECLENDIEEKKNHIVLVRTTSIKRAKDLYENVYKKYYKKYNPVLIVSKEISSEERKNSLEKLENLTSRIVVCVDMFGEGIDIPNLKIAAIHDKYKSLPITLQFIGRFARTSKGLGDASVITNIANEELKESLDELYSQDSDWNRMLADMSERAIGNEISLQELENGFKGTGVDGISVSQIIPKISMQAYKVNNSKPKWNNWKNIFDERKCKYYFNEEKKILIVIEASDSRIGWTNYKEINNLNWELHIVYYKEVKKVVCINSTVKGNARKIADELFSESELISGEKVFRCLYGINRLMLGTVGLNSAINGPIRYKMFAGIDIAQGITEAQRSTSTKSNLFGVGYNGHGKVSIGCSYKGIIWSRWVENIDFWMKWCDKIIDNVLDESIDVKELLEGVLIPKEIYKIPDAIPYRIDWPIELDLCNDAHVYLTNQYDKRIPLMNTAIELIEYNKKDVIKFKVYNEEFCEEFLFSVSDKGYNFEHKSGEILNINYGKSTDTLVDFFRVNPPKIKFVDQSILEGNYYVTLREKLPIEFPSKKIQKWDWQKYGVDITVESQGLTKKEKSIQYCVIQKLKSSGEYDIIFDDDNSGEIADIVAIKTSEQRVYFEFYHCKYSKGKKPGHRVNDLYEVCGQAEKSVEWKQDMRKVIDRMIKRENKRIDEGKTSRFEVGDFSILGEIKNKVKMYRSDLKIYIVQPGVERESITSDMNQILVASQTYLQETYSIEMELICS